MLRTGQVCRDEGAGTTEVHDSEIGTVIRDLSGVFARSCQNGAEAAHDALVGHLSVDVRASLRLFAFYLANGTLDLDLLDGVDYRSTVFHSGSSLEQVFAIYSNVLQIDADGMVLNDGDAQYRVAQWVRACCGPSYRVEPPFEDWEMELHL
ncbi:hypothetical protein ACH4GM_31255 [Streptomyces coeruleorubidus]|uniref:DUF7677 family protein n=1 Tax=Streptomyces coeruleorubidus TaxID=116188 RepID=UPI0037948608